MNNLLRVLPLVLTIFFVQNIYAEQMNERLKLAQETWSPLFTNVISMNKAKLKVDPKKLEATNELFYQSFSEFLNKEELLLQYKMYKTAVGKKIAENMISAMLGLSAQNIKYEDFSANEKEEWESFAKINHSKMKELEHKMKGFIPYIKSKLSAKK